MSKYIKDVVEDIVDNRILSIEQLQEEATYKEGDLKLDCYISLGGFCKSSLDIIYYPDDDTWDIFHYIDNCFVVYDSTEHMLKSTNLMKYIKQGYLIKE